MAPWAAAIPLISAGFNYLSNRGEQKRADAATKHQMQLAQALMRMQQQQFKVDLPFRKATLGMLNKRAQQRQPRIMPGRVQYSNPYRNVKKMTRPTAAGSKLSSRGPLVSALASHQDDQGNLPPPAAFQAGGRPKHATGANRQTFDNTQLANTSLTTNDGSNVFKKLGG